MLHFLAQHAYHPREQFGRSLQRLLRVQRPLANCVARSATGRIDGHFLSLVTTGLETLGKGARFQDAGALGAEADPIR